MANEPDEGEVLAAAWHELLGRYHRTTTALDRALVTDHGLTVSDFEVLQQLHGAPSEEGRMRLHELREQVHLSQSALSRSVTRLERAGLVARYVCEDDRRSAWTELTPLGELRYLEARPTHRAILRDVAGAERIRASQAATAGR